MSRPAFKRILLKLSGEALGSSETAFEGERLSFITREIAHAVKEGLEISIVIGGGNLIRGGDLKGLQIDRVTADQMGMVGTYLNALILKEFLRKEGIISKAFGPFGMPGALEHYDPFKARELLLKKQVVILAGGTGNPFFTTDTAAVLRAKELLAEVVFKATKVDYVYDRDPLKDSSAIAYKTISFGEAIQKRLRVMDLTALALAMELKVPICVFNFSKEGNLTKAAAGEEIGTFIWEE